jgi:hypothetical protein
LKNNHTSLSMDHCQVYGNKAVGDGGGVHASDKAAITVSDSLFFNNTAVNGGGLSLITTSQALFTNCQFNHNQATVNGGGLFLLTKSNFINCKIYSNIAYEAGGGSYISGSDITSTNILFDTIEVYSNLAYISGGGLYIQNGYISLNNMIISENIVRSPSFYKSNNITQSDIIYHQNDDDNDNSCDALSFGGCIYSSNYPKKYNHNERCKFIASDDGIIIFNYFLTELNYDILTISSSSYSGLIQSGEELTINKNDELVWNTNKKNSFQGFEICYQSSAQGGGVYIEGGESYIMNSIISYNSATRSGGGLYISGGNNIFENVDISYNNVSSYTSSSSTSTSFDFGIEVHFIGGTFDAVDLSIADYASASIAGVSSQTASCTSSCREGQYGNCSSSVKSASDCFVNCLCSNCSAGSASELIGSTSVDDCESCAVGQYSSEAATECITCATGRYASDNVSDTSGGLTTQVSSGATSCNACPSGYYAPITGSVACQTCNAGKYSNKAATECTSCAPGKFSSNGEQVCTICPSGKYESNAVSCNDCEDYKTSYVIIIASSCRNPYFSGVLRNHNRASGVVDCNQHIGIPSENSGWCLAE